MLRNVLAGIALVTACDRRNEPGAPPQTRRTAARVPVRAVARLQLSRLYGTWAGAPDEGAASFEGETWLDVRLDSLKAIGRNCGDSVQTWG